MKMVILIRTDLNMPVGKIAVQAAHSVEQQYEKYIEDQWNLNYRTKICLGVKSLDELMKYYNKAADLELPRKLVTDMGFTCFNEPTITCCSIGPATNDIIKKLTGRLRLL
jgi:PTH2 family peptidyl-tRNA hydrolase